MQITMAAGNTDSSVHLMILKDAFKGKTYFISSGITVDGNIVDIVGPEKNMKTLQRNKFYIIRNGRITIRDDITSVFIASTTTVSTEKLMLGNIRMKSLKYFIVINTSIIILQVHVRTPFQVDQRKTEKYLRAEVIPVSEAKHSAVKRRLSLKGAVVGVSSFELKKLKLFTLNFHLKLPDN